MFYLSLFRYSKLYKMFSIITVLNDMQTKFLLQSESGNHSRLYRQETEHWSSQSLDSDLITSYLGEYNMEQIILHKVAVIINEFKYIKDLDIVGSITSVLLSLKKNLNVKQ